MEIKREIVESRSEVSKDNLWLKPEGNKKKLLYYGIKGWTELSSSGTCEPSNPSSEIDLSKLTTDELLELNKKLEEIKKKLPPEEYVRILVSSYGNFYDIRKNIDSINNYVNNNLSGKWSYDYNGEKADIPQVVKVLDKGARLQLDPANPDLYLEVINDNGINFLILQTIVGFGIDMFFEYYGKKGGLNGHYELQNGEVKELHNVAISDYLKIVDRSVENGSAEVTDGFRPRTKGDTLIVGNNLDTILEYYRFRSRNNIIQDYGKYIILDEKVGSEYKSNKYKVVSTAGFSFRDYYIIEVEERGDISEDAKIHKENILEFIGEINIKLIRQYRKTEYLPGSGTKVTWNIKKGDKFFLASQPHIEFTVLADNIKPEDLEEINNLDDRLVYGNIGYSNYTYVEKYYPPYEDYKNPQNSEIGNTLKDYIKSVQEYKKGAEKSRDKLVILLDSLKDKIQYSGEFITTIQN